MEHKETPTLCFPDREKSCFACCPPIRPAAYEHIQHRNIVRRELRENTREFSAREPGVTPIRGFSCWALGYLDRQCRLVGCLLHPARNNGKDLRYRVDYGEKCRRESCRPSRTFLKLHENERRYWLALAEGLDAFAYSSKAYNPLLGLLGWGPEVLRGIFEAATHPILSKQAFFQEFPVFSTRLDPSGHAYILKGIAKKCGYATLRDGRFRQRFEAFTARLVRRLRQIHGGPPGGHFTHRLALDRFFLDFLRLSVGLKRADPAQAECLQGVVDREIENF